MEFSALLADWDGTPPVPVAGTVPLFDVSLTLFPTLNGMPIWASSAIMALFEPAFSVKI